MEMTMGWSCWRREIWRVWGKSWEKKDGKRKGIFYLFGKNIFMHICKPELFAVYWKFGDTWRKKRIIIKGNCIEEIVELWNNKLLSKGGGGKGNV